MKMSKEILWTVVIVLGLSVFIQMTLLKGIIIGALVAILYPKLFPEETL
jgi:hypothetical protein